MQALLEVAISIKTKSIEDNLGDWRINLKRSGVLTLTGKHEEVLSEIQQHTGSEVTLFRLQLGECSYHINVVVCSDQIQTSPHCAFSLILDGWHETSGRPKEPS